MSEHQAYGKRSVTFTVNADPGSKVYLGGTFNDWDYLKYPLGEASGDGVFVIVCMIAPGVHEYKFHVNGTWVLDRQNPRLCQNTFGSLNNVLEVS
jgi:1,4-alpha-glucan branching enzyme